MNSSDRSSDLNAKPARACSSSDGGNFPSHALPCKVRSPIATPATHSQHPLRCAFDGCNIRRRDIEGDKRFVSVFLRFPNTLPALHLPTSRFRRRIGQANSRACLKRAASPETLQTDPPSTSTVQQASRRHDNTGRPSRLHHLCILCIARY